jgi:threonine dehydratase
VGEAVFPIAQQYVHDVLLVDDADIVRAQQQLWNAARIVAEPGGAAAFAALVSGAYRPRVNERVAVIISGGNTSAVRLDSAPASVDVAVRTTHVGDGL